MAISSLQNHTSSIYPSSATVKNASSTSKILGDFPASAAATTSSTSDSVSISSAGQRRALETSDTGPTTESISSMLHTMPDKGAVATFVETAANIPDEALVSIGPAPSYTTHYSGTNIPVTEKSTATFKVRAKEVQEERLSIYREEKAKGTDPADIWDKMATFMRSLPDDFKLKASGWGNMG